jgi:hypothetical protein
LNPLGRGDGNTFVAGDLNIGISHPIEPLAIVKYGTGNSINNLCTAQGGCDSQLPSIPPLIGNDIVSSALALIQLMQDSSITLDEDSDSGNEGGGQGTVPPPRSYVVACCPGMPLIPCLSIPNTIARVACRAVGMSFFMPTPWWFCSRACKGKSAGCLKASLGCIILCVLPAGLAGVASKLAKYLDVLKNLIEFLRWLIGAIQAGKGLLEALYEFSKSKNMDADKFALFAYVAISLLQIGVEGIGILVAMIIACIGCCLVATHHCLVYEKQKSCKAEDGKTYNWGSTTCAGC